MALNAPGLEKSEITLYYEQGGGVNSEGRPYVRLLPYVKVRPYDSVNGHTGNDEYVMPSAVSYQTHSAQQEPYRQVMEQRPSGAFPYEDSRVGIEGIHEFHNI